LGVDGYQVLPALLTVTGTFTQPGFFLPHPNENQAIQPVSLLSISLTTLDGHIIASWHDFVGLNQSFIPQNDPFASTASAGRADGVLVSEFDLTGHGPGPIHISQFDLFITDTGVPALAGDGGLASFSGGFRSGYFGFDIPEPATWALFLVGF